MESRIDVGSSLQYSEGYCHRTYTVECSKPTHMLIYLVVYGELEK